MGGLPLWPVGQALHQHLDEADRDRGGRNAFRISHAREEVSPRRWNSPEAMIFIILNALRFASGNPHQLKLASQARIDRSTFSGSSLFGMGSNDLSLEA